jgi:hypothetical protein
LGVSLVKRHGTIIDYLFFSSYLSIIFWCFCVVTTFNVIVGYESINKKAFEKCGPLVLSFKAFWLIANKNILVNNFF